MRIFASVIVRIVRDYAQRDQDPLPRGLPRNCTKLQEPVAEQVRLRWKCTKRAAICIWIYSTSASSKSKSRDGFILNFNWFSSRPISLNYHLLINYMALQYILISIIALLIILVAIFFVKGKKGYLNDNPWSHLNKIQFITGICIALIGAGIMFHGNIFGEMNSGIATVIGIIGIGLIATSYRYRSQKLKK